VLGLHIVGLILAIRHTCLCVSQLYHIIGHVRSKKLHDHRDHRQSATASSASWCTLMSQTLRRPSAQSTINGLVWAIVVLLWYIFRVCYATGNEVYASWPNAILTAVIWIMIWYAHCYDARYPLYTHTHTHL
jgi:hypothetical protein